VTHDDICNAFSEDTLLAVVAPSGTQLEVPLPEMVGRFSLIAPCLHDPCNIQPFTFHIMNVTESNARLPKKYKVFGIYFHSVHEEK